MADYFQWDPKTLSVKVTAMDDEHQELIRRMNALHAARERKADLATVTRLVDEFASYTVKHFADEEAFMATIAFEGIGTHKAIHAMLLKQVGEHVAAFKKSGALTDAFFSFLSLWLRAHIQGVDVKYSAAGGAKAA